MSSNSGEEDHTWPAFVDALTTMTMILTFVMLILAVGIASLSQNVGKAVIEAVAEVLNRDAKPGQPQVTTFEEVTREIERLRNQPAPIQSVPVETERRIESTQPPERAPDARPVAATRSQAALTLVYPQRQHLLDVAAQEAVKSFLTESEEVKAARSLEIHAIASPASGSLSEARRLAYYRAMLMRAELIKNGISADRIVVRVVPPATGQDGESVSVYAKP
jgi:hypothetical protein